MRQDSMLQCASKTHDIKTVHCNIWLTWVILSLQYAAALLHNSCSSGLMQARYQVVELFWNLSALLITSCQYALSCVVLQHPWLILIVSFQICFLIFAVLYIVSYCIITRYKRKSGKCLSKIWMLLLWEHRLWLDLVHLYYLDRRKTQFLLWKFSTLVCLYWVCSQIQPCIVCKNSNVMTQKTFSRCAWETTPMPVE